MMECTAFGDAHKCITNVVQIVSEGDAIKRDMKPKAAVTRLYPVPIFVIGNIIMNSAFKLATREFRGLRSPGGALPYAVIRGCAAL